MINNLDTYYINFLHNNFGFGEDFSKQIINDENLLNQLNELLYLLELLEINIERKVNVKKTKAKEIQSASRLQI